MPLERAASLVRRRLRVGAPTFHRLLGELDLPRDSRVLVLGDEAAPEHLRALRRRFGKVSVGEPRGVHDLVFIDVAPDRVPHAVDELLPGVTPAPGGTIILRLVTDLVTAYRGHLPPAGAERMGEFLKRRFGRLRVDEPALRDAFSNYTSVRLIADPDLPFLGWAVLRVPGTPPRPTQALPTPRPRLPEFADEVRALAAEGHVTALDLVGPCADARCKAQAEKWGEWARTAFRGTVPLAGLPVPPLAADEETEVVVPGVAMALLPIPASLEAYLQVIGPKSRNMLRKFEREGYTTGPLDYNAHLDDLHAVNVSKPVRSGGPMTEQYLQPLKPIGTMPEPCPRHRSAYVGAFRDGRALGYSRVVLVNELAVIDQILGHAAALPHGVMNGLVRELVEVALAAGSVRAINYLTLRSSTVTLDRFKRSVGFEARTAYLRVPAR